MVFKKAVSVERLWKTLGMTDNVLHLGYRIILNVETCPVAHPWPGLQSCWDRSIDNNNTLGAEWISQFSVFNELIQKLNTYSAGQSGTTELFSNKEKTFLSTNDYLTTKSMEMFGVRVFTDADTIVNNL